jgi:Fur family ferric uptake transcriptional regulator/Fur family peroxide stress response transcriptional regulator
MAAAAAVRQPARLGPHAGAVLAALRATPHHPTAAALYDDVRRRHPRLGRATVYRALAALEAAGLVVEVWRDALGRHYDARTDPHDHAACMVCGRVADVERPPAPLPDAYTAAAAAGGHEVASYEVRYLVRCAACRGALAERTSSHAG